MNEINENQDIKDAVLGGEMTNQNKFKRNPELQPDDVISVEDSKFIRDIIPNHNTFKCAEIEKRFFSKIHNSAIKQLQEGIEVGVLSPHQPWRKGKLKLKIECKWQFIPEEESEE